MVELTGSGASKGFKVKDTGNALVVSDGESGIIVTQATAGEAEKSAIKITSKAKNKKGKKVKFPFAVTFDEDKEWIAVESVEAAIDKDTIEVGETAEVTYTVKPEGVALGADFESDNEAVATVDGKGIVTGVGAGKATISVTVGEATGTVDVTVVAEPEPADELKGVSIDITAPKVSEVINAVTDPVKVKDVDFAWFVLETAIAEIPDGAEPVGTEQSLTVTKEMKGKYLAVVASQTTGEGEEAVTVSFKAVTAGAVTEDNSGDVSIINTSAFQSDGTAVVNDTLKVSYGSNFGVPKSVTWYLNDVVDKNYTVDNGNLTLIYNPQKPGTVYAVIVAEDGQTYTSKNNVVVVEDQLAPTISDFEIVNDYEGHTLTAATADTHAIAKLKVSKWYAGKYYIFKKGVDYTKTNKFDDAFTGATYEVTKSTFTTKTLETGKDKYGNNIVPADGIYYQDDDGTTYFMWDITANPIRGTEYVIAFDQTALSADDIGTSVNENINMAAESAVAPYLTTPSAIELKTPTAGVGTYEVTFKNGDAQYEGLTEATASSFATTVVYTKTSATATTASSVGTVNTAFEDGKVKQEKLTNAVKTQIYYVESNLKAGIFGKAAEKLTSEEVTCGTPGCGDVSLTKDGTTPTTAKVTFKTKTLDDGVVYVTKNLTKFKAADSGSYTASAEVKKDATEAKVENAFDEAGDYYAVFVPATAETYSAVESKVYTFAAGVVAKIDFATVTGVSGASKGVELSSKIVATDAFGYGTTAASKTYDEDDIFPVQKSETPIVDGTGADVDYTGNPEIAIDGTTGTVTFTVGGAAVKGETYVAPIDVGSLLVTCTTAGSAETSAWDISYTTAGQAIYGVQSDDWDTECAAALDMLKQSGWTVTPLSNVTAMPDVAAGATLKMLNNGSNITLAGAFTNKGTIVVDALAKNVTFTGKITNDGTINISSGGTITTAAVDNNADATINVNDDATLGALVNKGTINNKAVLTLGATLESSGTFASKNGELVAAAAAVDFKDGNNEIGTATNTNGSTWTISGGTTAIGTFGDGTATGAFVAKGGTHTIGTLNTAGTVDLNTGTPVVTVTTFTKTGNATVAKGVLAFDGTVADGANTTQKLAADGGTLDFSDATVTADVTIAEPAAADGAVILPNVTVNGLKFTHAESTAKTVANGDVTWYAADGTTEIAQSGVITNGKNTYCTAAYTAATSTTPASLTWAVTHNN